MENKVVSTRGIRLLFNAQGHGKDYVQAVVLPDGRKLVITGSTYGMGAPISALTEIEVKRRSDLKWTVKDLVNSGYQEVSGSKYYDELREFDKLMPYGE